MNLATQDQEWLAVYQQRIAGVMFDDSRRLGSRAAANRYQRESEQDYDFLEFRVTYGGWRAERDHN